MSAGATPSPNDRTHVVHVLSTLNVGGVANLLLGLTSTPPFSELRHSVVCVNGVKGRMVESYREAGIDVWSCPLSWPEFLPIPSYRMSAWVRKRLAFTFRHRLASRLRALGATIVHSHVTARIDEQADAVLEGAGRPWVWTIHGMYQPSGEELERWKRAGRLCAGGRSRVTAVSGAAAADARERGFWCGHEIEVTYPGVDPGVHRARRTSDAAWRAERGISKDAVVYGTAGRLVPQKAYEVLLAAAERMVAKQIDFHVLIAGEGSERERLESQIRRRRLEERVTLVGHEADVHRFLSRLDVFVMSSRSEGCPVALLEAVAEGLPCIGTRVGGIPEILGDVAGILVAPEDPEELADAMQRLLSAATRKIVAARSEEVARRFSRASCSRRFAAIYREVLDEGRPKQEPR